MSSQERSSLIERRPYFDRLLGLPGEARKRRRDGVQGRSHVRFAATEGGETDPREAILKRADILATKGHVVQQIRGAHALVVGELGELFLVPLFCVAQLGLQIARLLQEGVGVVLRSCFTR
jgi:hypothetical protein